MCAKMRAHTNVPWTRVARPGGDSAPVAYDDRKEVPCFPKRRWSPAPRSCRRAAPPRHPASRRRTTRRRHPASRLGALPGLGRARSSTSTAVGSGSRSAAHCGERRGPIPSWWWRSLQSTPGTSPRFGGGERGGGVARGGRAGRGGDLPRDGGPGGLARTGTGETRRADPDPAAGPGCGPSRSHASAPCRHASSSPRDAGGEAARGHSGPPPPLGAARSDPCPRSR